MWKLGKRNPMELFGKKVRKGGKRRGEDHELIKTVDTKDII